jgi:hypothetical protein
MSDKKPLVGLGQELVEFWDEFHFVGNSYNDRTIWAVGMCCGDIIVSEVKQPQLSPDVIPTDAVFYPQRFLLTRPGMTLHKPKMGVVV